MAGARASAPPVRDWLALIMLHGRSGAPEDMAGLADHLGLPDIAIRAPQAVDGTPVPLGCHEQDPHIPLTRVRTSEKAFRNLGAKVTNQIHPGAGHGIVAEEISALGSILNTSGQ
ncbi:hypothetical protein [Phaeovulum sp.]|uniref:hypothetical protein n=1 Tax=Phaeovulum sp. TaxID=2934796 RepID=UPI0039E4F9E9